MSAVFLASDLQIECLSLLDPALAETLTERTLAFSDKMNTMNVPTFWLAIGQVYEENFYLPAGKPWGPVTPTGMGLPKQLCRPGDAYFNKIMPNAFCPAADFACNKKEPLLQTVLKDLGHDFVIIAGLFTDKCVRRTIEGALKHGFACIAAYDLMACDTASPQENRDPFWHATRLQTRIGLDGAGVIYKRSYEIPAYLFQTALNPPRQLTATFKKNATP